MNALARIGGNLNQIARQANTAESDIEKIKVFSISSYPRSTSEDVLETMIVKILGNKGGGSAGAVIDYMLGKDKDREACAIT